MLSPRHIIYGMCTTTSPQKFKYLISLYRSEELNIIAVFPTSQPRAGCLNPQHGPNRRNGDIVSYVFEGRRPIGLCPDSSKPFCFPIQTTIPFDYCFREDSQDTLIQSFINPTVVGILSQEEYSNLLYAFIKSSRTPKKYIKIFSKILQDLLNP